MAKLKVLVLAASLRADSLNSKLAALAAIVPLLFFFIACQDQVGEDMMNIAKNSSHVLQIPAHIQRRMETLQKENPGKNYAVVELNETAAEKLETLKDQYGLPTTIEVFETLHGKPVNASSSASPVVKGEASAGILVDGQTRLREEGRQTFAIFQFTEEANKLAEASQEDKIYTVVQQQPEFPGGYDAMIEFLRNNLQYPTEARQQGIEGTVYVSFVIGKDGTLSDPKVIRGISAEADAEALRVMQLSPPWTPGKQNKQPVAVRFVLPIKFQLDQPNQPVKSTN